MARFRKAKMHQQAVAQESISPGMLPVPGVSKRVSAHWLMSKAKRMTPDLQSTRLPVCLVQGLGTQGSRQVPGTHHRLEAGVKLCQERRLPGESQHPFLDHGALHVIVLDNNILLQDLNSIELVGALPLRQHDLCQGENTCRMLVNTHLPHL